MCAFVKFMYPPYNTSDTVCLVMSILFLFSHCSLQSFSCSARSRTRRTVATVSCLRLIVSQMFCFCFEAIHEIKHHSYSTEIVYVFCAQYARDRHSFYFDDNFLLLLNRCDPFSDCMLLFFLLSFSKSRAILLSSLPTKISFTINLIQNWDPH